MAAAIGIDIGGTFTDIVVLDGRGPRLFKFPSDPRDPARGVLRALAALIERGEIAPSDVQRIAHGSTVATNALLEGKLGETALLTTRGFRVVLEIGRQNRPTLYGLFFERPRPIAPRDLRFEVTERVDAQGNAVNPLSEEETLRVCAEIRKRGAESVAVCFLFSFLNPTHEKLVGAILAQDLGPPVTLSSDLLPEFREYERTSTTVVNAALRPVVGTYLSTLEEGAARLGLPQRWQVMQSSGAIAHAGTVQDAPARILLSGPAGGVEGARAVGRRAGFPDLITMDMGGTSCDVALIRDGNAIRTTGGTVGGHPVALPMTDIHTIGTGGGSIARLDRGGALSVGPVGLLLAEIGHETSQGLVHPLRAVPPAELSRLLKALHDRGASELVAHGVDRQRLAFASVAALRYRGQSHELDVALPEGKIGPGWIAVLEAAFHEEHRRRYGHAAPDEEVELVALRARASVPPPAAHLRPAAQPAPRLPAVTRAWFDRSGPMETRLVHRNALGPGARIEGPAILLGADATALLPPGCTGTVDAHGTLVVEAG